jgi:hypothetical protein
VIERPVFIAAPPRSGGTALFRSLARARGVFSAQSPILDGIFELEPENREWDSNRLTAADVEARAVEELRGRLKGALTDSSALRGCPSTQRSPAASRPGLLPECGSRSWRPLPRIRSSSTSTASRLRPFPRCCGSGRAAGASATRSCPTGPGHPGRCHWCRAGGISRAVPSNPEIAEDGSDAATNSFVRPEAQPAAG